jgi:hypothetical protein
MPPLQDENLYEKPDFQFSKTPPGPIAGRGIGQATLKAMT